MGKLLFIVCPFSCMETFLKKEFGDDIYFVTFPGASLPYKEWEYISEIRKFIAREGIQTIYIVNDTSCRFINSIITKEKIFGFESEKIMEELYIENYFNVFKGRSVCIQKYRLAEIYIRRQLNELLSYSLLDSYILEYEVEIKGLLTSKLDKSYQQIEI